MTIGVTGGAEGARVDAGYGRNSGWFDIEVAGSEDRVVSSPSEENEVVDDWVALVSEAGNIATDFFISLLSFPRPTWSGDSPTLSIVSGPANVSGTVVSSTGNGNVLIRASNEQGLTKDVSVTANIRTVGDPSTVWLSFVDGSLAHSCEDAINWRIRLATTSNLPIFNNYSASNVSGVYQRNTNCWASPFDLTCISPWNSRTKHLRAGTAITQRHIITAAHYELQVGDTLRWVTDDNTVITRTIIGKKRHPDYAPYYPDITIYLLDSDLPESITPCKVLPDDYEDYLPRGGTHIAALCLDQEEKALVTDVRSLGDRIYFQYPDQEYEQALYEGKVVGDSGNPAFWIINDELVLLTCWTWGGAGAGTFTFSHKDVINQLIEDLDTEAEINTGYALSEVDLSPYPNFSTKNYLIENHDLENGNASLWVESGLLNGKMSYKKRFTNLHGYGYQLLSWDGSRWFADWHTYEYRFTSDILANPIGSLDESYDDVATPDLATFDTLNFVTP